jgi:uncharacterized membrane protein YagU involved in acid resistance
MSPVAVRYVTQVTDRTRPTSGCSGQGRRPRWHRRRELDVSTAAQPAHAAPAAHPGVIARIENGALAGLAGGLLFGLLMAMTGMLPTVAGLVGSENAVVGFGVHLVNSAVIGAIFGLLAWGFADKVWRTIGAGLAYGVVWWVLGALIVMPLWLGITMDSTMRDMVLTVEADQWMSLVGHAIFGVTAALALIALRRRHHS